MKKILGLILISQFLIISCTTNSNGVALNDLRIIGVAEVKSDQLNITTQVYGIGAFLNEKLIKIGSDDELLITYNDKSISVNKENKTQTISFELDPTVTEFNVTFKRESDNIEDNLIYQIPPTMQLIAPLENSVYLANEEIDVQWNIDETYSSIDTTDSSVNGPYIHSFTHCNENYAGSRTIGSLETNSGVHALNEPSNLDNYDSCNATLSVEIDYFLFREIVNPQSASEIMILFKASVEASVEIVFE